MKNGMQFLAFAAFIFLYFSHCNLNASFERSDKVPDSASVAAGKAIFIQHCSGCHNFHQDGIGPQLGSITDTVSSRWIHQFIKDPKKMIASGDQRAQQLYHRYQVAMPSFPQLTKEQISQVISFLKTKKRPSKRPGHLQGLDNPVVGKIPLSNLVIDLELVTQFPSTSTNGKRPRARITKLDYDPSKGSSFVLDLQGRLYKMKNKNPFVYLDMTKTIPNFKNEPGLGTGFGSFAFHPEFAKNGLLYTAHTETAVAGKADFTFPDSIKVVLQCVLREWKTNNVKADTFSGTSREVLRINMVSVSHGIQDLAFNPLSKQGQNDYGKLYIAIGDGGSAEEGYGFLTGRKDKIWGTVLRIDPQGRNAGNRHYGIPPDNPFATSSDDNSLREVYAYGFRNPHRITWSKSGMMLVSNIGGSSIESINWVQPGHNYGWPLREGYFATDPNGDLTKVFPLPANDSMYKFTYPIAQLGHYGGWTAISGGVEYWGTSIQPLMGKLIFGDIASGKLYFIELSEVRQGKQAPVKEWKVTMNGKPTTLRELCENERVDLHFGRDAQGDLYMLTKTDGKLYHIVGAHGL